MKCLSLRWRYALWSGAATSVTLCIFAAATLWFVYQEQLQVVDDELKEEALELVYALEQFDASTIEWIHHGWLSWTVFDRDGRMLRVDPALPETLARAVIDRQTSVAGMLHAHNRRFITVPHDDATLLVAYDMRRERAHLRLLAAFYLLALPVAGGLSLGMGWLLAARALAPLGSLTRAAETMAADKLDRRVTIPATRDEIHRLAVVFNCMLDRLERSFCQAQRFTADASHELRTPLAIIRGELDSLLAVNPLDPALEERLISLQEEIARLDRLAEQLLLLAYLDTGKALAACATVDMTQLVQEACEDADMLATAHDVQLIVDLARGVLTRGEPVMLRRLVLNLLDNATRYNASGGRVRCTLRADDQQVELRVANTGPGIPDDLHEKLFERFTRGASTRVHGGSGLGLALCREIAAMHNGKITLAGPGIPGWTEFLVRLPAVSGG
jgi:signal transduction histidine kinase